MSTYQMHVDLICLVCEGSEMGAGDPGMEDIYHWDQSGPRIAFKGDTGDTGASYCIISHFCDDGVCCI